jgi:hypothetical protein
MMLPGLPSPDPAASLAAAATAADWWRCPASGVEWHHFVVVAEGLRLVLNFSTRTEGGRRRHRILALLMTDGTWTGGVDDVDDADVEQVAGRIDAFFGESHIRFSGGEYHLRLAHRASGLRAELRLAPVAAPLLATNLRLGDGARFSWCGVPRLVVTRGSVSGKTARRLDGATAYHDHNWGSFTLGQDLVWEWFFAVPLADRDPWSCMGLKISDRGRHRTLSAGLALWRDGRLWQVFRDADVHVGREGRHVQAAVHQLPDVPRGAIASAASVPALSRWSGTSGEDRLEAVVRSLSLAQVAIPAGVNVVSVAEVAAEIEIQGSVRGRSIRAPLFGILEVVDG